MGNELLQISGESESELPFNKGKHNIFTESQKLQHFINIKNTVFNKKPKNQSKYTKKEISIEVNN